MPFKVSDKADIATKWKALEVNSYNSIFLSWTWIGNWLELVNENIYLIEASEKNKVVGLGFLVERSRKVFGFYPIKQWFLHRTGNPLQDQIWIEHNDFLLKEGMESEIRHRMISAIYQYHGAPDEIVVGLSSENVISAFNKYYDKSRELIKSASFCVDFNSIENCYIEEVLSKNSRAQIARSKKELLKIGKLEFEIISEQARIKSLLPEIANIHIQRWGNTKEGSGFSNALFEQFHQLMLDDSGTVQVAMLKINDRAIGYLVNFVYGNKVCFYLSALTPFKNNKIKVGLTLHTLAIQYYMEQNINIYDFLAGNARYKRSLSNKTYSLIMSCFYKNNYLLVIENKLKYIKNQINLSFINSFRKNKGNI